MNKVILMGRLTADPELRHARNGTIWIRFTLAVNRRGAKDGQQQADFIQCKAFNQTAEFIAKWFGKGRLMAIDGELSQNTWEDDHGNKKSMLDVTVWNAYFTGEKREETGGSVQTPQRQDYARKQNPQGSMDMNGFVDLDDDSGEDDLPF